MTPPGQMLGGLGDQRFPNLPVPSDSLAEHAGGPSWFPGLLWLAVLGSQQWIPGGLCSRSCGELEHLKGLERRQANRTLRTFRPATSTRRSHDLFSEDTKHREPKASQGRVLARSAQDEVCAPMAAPASWTQVLHLATNYGSSPSMSMSLTTI